MGDCPVCGFETFVFKVHSPIKAENVTSDIGEVEKQLVVVPRRTDEKVEFLQIDVYYCANCHFKMWCSEFSESGEPIIMITGKKKKKIRAVKAPEVG